MKLMSLARSLAISSLALGILAAGSPVGAGEVKNVDGMTRVVNGSTPRDGTERLQLEELWRVGGDDEEGLLLGLVSEVCGDEAGNVYVLDSQLCQVHVFSREGDLLRTIFRQGEGPGETLRPRDMIITEEGVGLLEEFPGKIIMVDREGLPLDNIRIGGPGSVEAMYALSSGTFAGGNLVVSGVEIRMTDQAGMQDRRNFLISLLPTGEERARYCDLKTSYDYNEFKFYEGIHAPNFWWGHTVGQDGRVYVAKDREEYAVSVFMPDGILDRIIEKEYEPYLRTKAERKRMDDLFNTAAQGMPVDAEFVIEDSEPAIDGFHRGLRIAEDGSLWITSSRGLRGQTEGVMLTYDVFDSKGHFIRQVEMACEGDGWYDMLFWVKDDQVVLVKGAMAALVAQFGGRSALDSEDEEPTPQEVICYRVVN